MGYGQNTILVVGNSKSPNPYLCTETTTASSLFEKREESPGSIGRRALYNARAAGWRRPADR